MLVPAFREKFLRLSFSNNEALLTKQLKYFNFNFENFIIFLNLVLLQDHLLLNKLLFYFLTNSFCNFSASDLDLL